MNKFGAARIVSKNSWIARPSNKRLPSIGVCIVGSWGDTPASRAVYMVQFTHREDRDLVSMFTVIAGNSQSAITQVDRWVTRNIGADFPLPTADKYIITVMPLTPEFPTISLGVVSFSYVW